MTAKPKEPMEFEQEIVTSITQYNLARKNLGLPGLDMQKLVKLLCPNETKKENKMIEPTRMFLVVVSESIFIPTILGNEYKSWTCNFRGVFESKKDAMEDVNKAFKEIVYSSKKLGATIDATHNQLPDGIIAHRYLAGEGHKEYRIQAVEVPYTSDSSKINFGPDFQEEKEEEKDEQGDSCVLTDRDFSDGNPLEPGETWLVTATLTKHNKTNIFVRKLRVATDNREHADYVIMRLRRIFESLHWRQTMAFDAATNGLVKCLTFTNAIGNQLVDIELSIANKQDAKLDWHSVEEFEAMLRDCQKMFKQELFIFKRYCEEIEMPYTKKTT